MQEIIPCLWFDSNAQEAAKYYVSIFKKSKITKTLYYPGAGEEIHQKPTGSVLMVEFELNGRKFTALNAGPEFKFNQAVSFQVMCESQEEIDYYWRKLSAGGDKKAQQCSWLKDKYGLSWQIFPVKMAKMLADKDRKKANSAMSAMMKMKKINMKVIEKAYKG